MHMSRRTHQNPMLDRPLTELDAKLAEITAAEDKRDNLMLQFKKSLAIRAIWKDAFKDSSATIGIGTMTQHDWIRFEQGRHEITHGYIKRLSDGAKFPLSASQFRTLHYMPNGKG